MPEEGLDDTHRSRTRSAGRARHGRIRAAVRRRRCDRVPVRRAALAEYLRDYPNLLDHREVVAKTVHQTTDPEVSIAEFELAGIAVATQKPYRLRYVVVLTVRDGLIRRYRDYWSPLAVTDVLGVPGV
ncbi:nuclear transport factor 2 family protein [Amycolatopsis circi]|uniref:nuclear transport factor 2 family protein n=1 Tax=Amycolatopsis circi TaxID=871959 RepID=UPI0031344FFA